MNNWIRVAWVGFPYTALVVFLVGSIYRYITIPFHWNSDSSQLLERKQLMAGSFLFHYGIIGAFFGHVTGLLVPQSLWASVGIPPDVHEIIAKYLGGSLGAITLLGLLILIWRRIRIRCVNRAGSSNSLLALFLLFVPIATGVWNSWVVDYNYLFTIAPWVRELFILVPMPGYMTDIPVSFWIHILSAFALIAYIPFSRLVHMFSVPVPYVFRRFVLYRRRKVRGGRI